MVPFVLPEIALTLYTTHEWWLRVVADVPGRQVTQCSDVSRFVLYVGAVLT